MRLRKDTDVLLEEEILFISSFSDSISHPVRVKLLSYIFVCNKESKPVCNSDMVQDFNYSQATISQHLKKMVESGLLQIKKQDRFSYYYVNIGLLAKYMDTLKKLNF